jgi:hypothetical protein
MTDTEKTTYCKRDCVFEADKWGPYKYDCNTKTKTRTNNIITESRYGGACGAQTQTQPMTPDEISQNCASNTTETSNNSFIIYIIGFIMLLCVIFAMTHTKKNNIST